MSFLIYTQPNCNYCTRAKEDLTARGLIYEEILVLPKGVAFASHAYEIARDDLKLLFPGRTHLPIILCDGQMIGGYDNLKDHLAKENEHNG